MNGIVVVVSGGNTGAIFSGVVFPPANDPFVISVGAVDDKGTTAITDDTIPASSASGTTSDGFAKPDLVARRQRGPASNPATIATWRCSTRPTK